MYSVANSIKHLCLTKDKEKAHKLAAHIRGAVYIKFRNGFVPVKHYYA